MLLFIFSITAIVWCFFAYKFLWNFTERITRFIQRTWLRITIQIILNTIFFVVLGAALFSLLIVILAFNTGKSKK
jgi:hypothetical protein